MNRRNCHSDQGAVPKRPGNSRQLRASRVRNEKGKVAGLVEGREQRGRLLLEEQRAAAHGQGRESADAAPDRDCPRHHAGGTIVAGVPFDQQHPATHAIAGAIRRIAPHQHHASPHPLVVAGQGGGEEIAGVAADPDLTVAHAGRGVRPGVALHLDGSAAHHGSQVGAGVALHHDSSLGHACANPVEKIASRPDLDLVARAPRDREQLVHAEPLLPARQLHGGHGRLRLRGESVGRERRQINPLGGALLEGQDERTHGAMISRKRK